MSVSTPGGTAQGIENVVAQARRNHEVPTQHVITNVLVDLDGDRATAGANLVVHFPDSIQGERYAFEARRDDEAWRLTRIEVEPIWSAADRHERQAPRRRGRGAWLVRLRLDLAGDGLLALATGRREPFTDAPIGTGVFCPRPNCRCPCTVLA